METLRPDAVNSAPPPLRALILEDNPRDARLTASVLEGGNGKVQCEVTDSLESFREHLEKAEYDIILADFNLRDWSAFDALDILKHSGRDVPLIVVTGVLGDEAAVECIKQGAADYVLKDRPARLPTAVKRALEEKRLRTETKRALEAVTWLATIVESSDDAIIGMTKEGVITSWNRGAEKLFGYPSTEILGHPVSALIPPDRSEELAIFLANAGNGARMEQFETVRLRKNGSLVDVSLSVFPLIDSRGAVSGAASIAHDITGRKRADEALEKRIRELTDSQCALEQKAQELARSNAELQQFAYVASHDLQEPVRTIVGFAQLLQKRYQGKLDANADDFIGFIVNGAARMQGHIQDLLAYSRVGSRGRDFVPTECAKVFDQALANLQAAVAESGALVTHDALPVVSCDGEQLIQVFQNLIGNSIKFRESHAPRIHVAAERRFSEWVFSVKDNGIGIDPQYANRIFEVFQRLHSPTEYPGNGIGLSIAKKIVERHGGRIWVESQPHQGATFFFTLPA
jgi:PAS domain S-box-containing protein